MKILPKIFGAILLWTAAFFCSCSDSLDITYDESESRQISIEAFMTHSFENDAERQKQDTIIPGDSIIFLSYISPSKSIRLQRYYWIMDDKLFANEFSFKGTVQEIGKHSIAFVLVDFFGDTIQSALTLYVSEPPRLDSTGFAPCDGTQSLSPLDMINFVWSKESNDTLWKVNYRFTLAEAYSGEKIVDTLLETASYTYTQGLKPLEKYVWTVQAQNELRQFSKYTLKSSFYTSGSNQEGALYGIIKTNSLNSLLEYNITVLDDFGNPQHTFSRFTTERDGSFVLKPLAPGSGKLVVTKTDMPDFAPDTVCFKIQAKMFSGLHTISLVDTIPPTLTPELLCDTIEVADTLKFFVSDRGSELKVNRMSALLENVTLQGLLLQGDTLYVPLPDLRNSWTYRILSVAILDQSNNRTSKTFYLKPSTSLKEVLDD